uniref:hypothetical protein n=2 Tax=Rhizobium meliloti TaxID=382 RepID=UPI00051862A3
EWRKAGTLRRIDSPRAAQMPPKSPPILYKVELSDLHLDSGAIRRTSMGGSMRVPAQPPLRDNNSSARHSTDASYEAFETKFRVDYSKRDRPPDVDQALIQDAAADVAPTTEQLRSASEVFAVMRSSNSVSCVGISGSNCALLCNETFRRNITCGILKRA